MKLNKTKLKKKPTAASSFSSSSSSSSTTVSRKKNTRTTTANSNNGNISGNNNHNSNAKDKIEVVCRFRPQIVYELEIGGKNCVNFADQKTVLVKNEKRENVFTFDKIFPQQSSQHEVFEHVGRPALEDVLKGYNATIFAYGQTSAGKTYTMMSLDRTSTEGEEGEKQKTMHPVGPSGSKKTDNTQQRRSSTSRDHRGIGPRIVDALFEEIDRAYDCVEFTVKISFFEIYMERVNDLLSPQKTNLMVKEESGKGFFVHDLTEIYVASEMDVMKLLEYGNANKQRAFTRMNSDSSRSHTILSIHITQHNTMKGEKTAAKLYIVDLAGSEKVHRTNASGIQLEEAKSINQSLATLGKVINALTDGVSTHVPYRESKLTKLLQEALGGNSRTTLLINCSPSNLNYEETLSTLRFGTSAKNIRTKPKINYESTTSDLEKRVVEYQNIIKELTETKNKLSDEVARLKELNSVHQLRIMNANNEVKSKEDDIKLLKEEIENYATLKEEYNSKLATISAQISKEKEDVETSSEKLTPPRKDVAYSPDLSINSIGSISTPKFNDVVKHQRENSASLGNLSDKLSGDDIDSEIFSMIFENGTSHEFKGDNRSTLLLSEMERENKLLKASIYSFLANCSYLKEEDSQFLGKVIGNVDDFDGKNNEFMRNKKLVLPLKGGLKFESPTKTDNIGLEILNNNDDDDEDEDDDDSDSEDEHDEEKPSIFKCGYLYILENIRISNGEKKPVWSQRWCILPRNSHILKCFKGLTSTNPYEIDVKNSIIEEQPSTSSQEGFAFKVCTQNNKIIYLKVASISDRQEWIHCLKVANNSVVTKGNENEKHDKLALNEKELNSESESDDDDEVIVDGVVVDDVGKLGNGVSNNTDASDNI